MCKADCPYSVNRKPGSLNKEVIEHGHQRTSFPGSERTGRTFSDVGGNAEGLKTPQKTGKP
jgi:hypothetical protein